MIIGGQRGCGKTTRLIKEAAKNGYYIVCADIYRRKYITDLAAKMDLRIITPVLISELPIDWYAGKVLIDDVEDVLKMMIGRPVVMMTTSETMVKLESKNKLEAIDVIYTTCEGKFSNTVISINDMAEIRKALTKKDKQFKLSCDFCTINFTEVIDFSELKMSDLTVSEYELLFGRKN